MKKPFSILKQTSLPELPDGILEALMDRDASYAAAKAAGRAEGYAEALSDLSRGCKGISNFALISVAPVVHVMHQKLASMK